MPERPATVGSLIEHLKQFPADLEVLYRLCSDYAPLDLGDVVPASGVLNRGGWVMRVFEEHIPTMSERNVRQMKLYLLFPGN
jgi:hypothetical protein